MIIGQRKNSQSGVSMTSQEPIFKSVFGNSWSCLPPVMHKHYANRPHSNDISTVEGTLNVMCKWYLMPLFWLFDFAPPYNETNVPVTVHFTSDHNSPAFCFDRVFYFKNRKPFHFRSRMTQVKDREIAERMSYGICWHSHYFWDGKQVLLQHKGYSLRLGNIYIPLPITWLIGRSDACETPVDDKRFDMSATITHPWLGKIYGYKGRFEVVKEV